MWRNSSFDIIHLLLHWSLFFFIFYFINSVSRYGNKCEWLTNDKFLKDLEGDSVDAEILDEELRLLHEQQPKTWVALISLALFILLVNFDWTMAQLLCTYSGFPFYSLRMQSQWLSIKIDFIVSESFGAVAKTIKTDITDT